MKDIDFAADRLQAGNIFFFAGSGISYASNLPSAYAVLEHTANVFLPSTISDIEKKAICDTIQPEVFYESIIGMTRSYECLDMWRSLFGAEQAKHGIQCTPGFVHLFIVAYSSQNHLPIITTNFDTMFEQACHLLNIKYRVFLPTDPPPDMDAGSLPICKIHGSIQDNGKAYSPQTLWTTMTQITKVNTRWIEFLKSLMAKKHLCFVGYSGRDIDFFPYIAEFPKKRGAKRIIWINRFEGDHSDDASRSCDALRICMWPDELFESLSHRLGIRIPGKSGRLADNAGNIETLLHSLEKSLVGKHLLTDTEKELLYCILLAKLGNYFESHRYAIGLQKKPSSYFSHPSNKQLLLLTCARLSHEVSQYERCKMYARQVYKGKYDVNATLQSSCLLSEAHRMSIPNDIYFGTPKKIRDYLYVIYVMGHFVYTALKAQWAMHRQNLKDGDLGIETQHELIEHRIRFYALIQSLLGSPQRGWGRLAKAFLFRAWDGIREMSYRAGYAAGIANAGKFKYRLHPSEKTKSESASIYTLTTSATGRELLVRNEADQLLRDGNFSQSRSKFLAYADMAKKSGNTLNEIKGILGIAQANRLEGKTPWLTDKERIRFSNLVDRVQGKQWKNHFAYIESILAGADRDKTTIESDYHRD